MKRIIGMMLSLALLMGCAALAEAGTTRWQLGSSILDLPSDWPLELVNDGKKLEGGGIQIICVDLMPSGMSNLLDGLTGAIRNQMIMTSDSSRYNATDSFTADNGAFGTLFKYNDVLPAAHIVNGKASVMVGVQPGAYEPQQVFDAVALGLSADEAAVKSENTTVKGDFAVELPSGWMKSPGLPGLTGELTYFGDFCTVSFNVSELGFTGDPAASRDQMLSQNPQMQGMDNAAGIPCVYYLDSASNCFTVILFSDDSAGIITASGDDQSKWEEAGKNLADHIAYAQ